MAAQTISHLASPSSHCTHLRLSSATAIYQSTSRTVSFTFLKNVVCAGIQSMRVLLLLANSVASIDTCGGFPSRVSSIGLDGGMDCEKNWWSGEEQLCIYPARVTTVKHSPCTYFLFQVFLLSSVWVIVITQARVPHGRYWQWN